MRLHVISALHLEVAPFAPPAPPADVVVIAGDVDEGVAGLHWARLNFPARRIVFVAGIRAVAIQITHGDLRAVERIKRLEGREGSASEVKHVNESFISRSRSFRGGNNVGCRESTIPPIKNHFLS